MADITIAELVQNGTLSAEMAAVLWAAVDEQKSFLTVAVPRFAGKTTTSNAVLALRPPDVSVTPVTGEPEEMQQLATERRGGYLTVAEFASASMHGYIWGEPVRRVFNTVVSAGYALQTALHAPGVDAGMQEVTRGNGVSDHHASEFKLVMYIERFGETEASFWRRVTDLYEVDRVEDGRPVGRSLFRWHDADDRFERLAEPQQWGQDRTSTADVTAAVAQYRSNGG